MKRWILHIGCWVWLVMAAVPARGMTLADSVASTMLRYCHPDDYVRACHRYGRWLLDEQNMPAEAMQVFLKGAHTATSDYVRKGRCYANIGRICRMANRHDLSYAIYQRSANCFLQAGDSTLYYYGLNNMAFEKAEIQDKQAADSILSFICTYCSDSAVLTKILETQASACLSTEQYDSVIYYTTKLFKRGYHDPAGYCYASIAWYYLGLNDSALAYARHVVATTNEPSYLISAYYILSHNDTTLGADSILAITSMRADAQNEWGIHHGKLTQAVQLLEEDLNRKPDLGWLYAVIGTIFILSIGISIYIIRRKRQNALLAQQIKRQRQEQKDLYAVRVVHIEQECLLLGQLQDLYEGLSWRNYEQMCTIVNSRLYNIVDKLMPLHLSEREVRLCILELLNYSNAQMAIYLTYAQSGIGKLKNTTAKKLGTDGRNMRTFLISYIAK